MEQSDDRAQETGGYLDKRDKNTHGILADGKHSGSDAGGDGNPERKPEEDDDYAFWYRNIAKIVSQKIEITDVPNENAYDAAAEAVAGDPEDFTVI